MAKTKDARTVDWDAIKTEYITTNISYRKLAAKHNVNASTLFQRGNRENWAKQKEQFKNRVVAKNVKKAEEKAIDYRSVLYELAYKVAGQLNDMTNSHTVEELALAGIKPRDITGAIKDLEDALHIKSDKDLKEQEARIAKMQKEIDGEQVDRTVTVKFAEDAERWGG